MNCSRLSDEVYSNLPSYVQIGVILSELRILLDIKNEEFVSEDVSLGTVSNFFNGRYICDFETEGRMDFSENTGRII